MMDMKTSSRVAPHRSGSAIRDRHVDRVDHAG
jgi:hypothetical protein